MLRNSAVLFAYLYWPYALGLLIGVVYALGARRHLPTVTDRAGRIVAALVSAIALMFTLTPAFAESLRWFFSIDANLTWLYMFTQSQVYFAAPLLVGALAITALLCVPLPTPASARAGMGAHLSPRSIRSFVRPEILTLICVLSAIALGIALAAGRVADPDEDGRLLLYTIGTGSSSASTWIYGWYFSVPALITLAMLIALTWVTLTKISRPPLAFDAATDSALRRSRSRLVTNAALGALFLHLAYVAIFLDGTASITLVSGSGATGSLVETWSTFAALTPALRITGMILQTISIALWTEMFVRATLGPRKTREP